MRFDQNQKAFLSLRDQVGERTKRMVVWLGAGMSAGVGMPTWAGLKSILEDSADAKARTLDHAARTRMEKEILVSRRESNPWIAFKMLKELLGHTSYQDEIRRALAQAPRVEISSTYKDIWNLPIHGVLNLNIDRIASRAFQTIRPGASLIEFPGQQAASMTHALNSTRPFLANLHGDVESVNTWVFTHDELTKLVRFKGYQNFINSCISTYTILFLGITADDQAVGGNLEWFTKNRIDAGPHFWLTDRQDRETDLWAERAGIRVIRYTNPDGKHEQVDEFLHALLTFIPTDDESTISPVSLSTIKIDNKVKIQAPDALVREDTEVIREALNKRTTEILSVMTESSYREYENFCTEYDEAIHRAWYVSTKPGKNNVLGYTLNEEVARGAFGQVYRATSPSGEQVAVKVLLEASLAPF